MQLPRLVAVALVAALLSSAPAAAERAIVDLHRLDAYFELFAGDSSAPWKAPTVRLDTYSSAPVAFSVYQVDPTDVLRAGANSAARPIVTAGRRALLSFQFTPPGGYQFQSSEVNVPLGTREGFFVIEARRGNVGEQVWVNRSRIAIIAKQTPAGLMIYGADLGTGMPLARMRVTFVVNRSFATALTNTEGIVNWNRSPRPVFALAQWGASYAFLSLLPQAPLPPTIVGVRTDSAVVHAGDAVRVIGFARTRWRGVLRPAAGTATVTIRAGARAIAEQSVALDAAGAFTAAFALPQNAPAGEYAVLAQVGSGIGGASIHVDANAGALSLDVGAACNGACDPRQDVPLLVHASRGGVIAHVSVIRSPHVYVGDASTNSGQAVESEDAPWGTEPWFDTSVQTDGNGNATVSIPHPTDELGSTYGVHVDASGATADTRVVVATADAAIRLQLDRREQSLGTPIGYDVYAGQLDGKPLAGTSVTVRMIHGASVAEQELRLDAGGHARGSFASPALGANLIFASVDRGGRATDAAQLQIDPNAAVSTIDGGAANVHVAVDKNGYRAGEEIAVDAAASGSQGNALITLESALGVQARVLPVTGGHAVAHLHAVDAAGELRVGAAFVRDGTIEWNTVPIVLFAPGRPNFAHLALAGTLFSPGETAHIALDGAGAARGTFVVRISRGEPSGSALFTSAPMLLAIGVTTTQNSAPEMLTWHPGVNSTGDRAQVLGFVRRTQPPPETLAQADTAAVAWSVERGAPDGIPLALPARSGRYTVSVLDICDDGSLSAGSSTVVVR